MKVTRPPERMLFGTFLVEQKKITGNDLALALYKQSKERISNHNTRRLGEILLTDYRIFANQEELDQAIAAFRDYKEEMSSIYHDARELAHEARAEVAGCDDEEIEQISEEMGLDLAGVEIEELQGYVSVIDAFLDAADEVADHIKLKQCDRDGMVEVARKMAHIRQALLSVAAKD